MGICFPLAHATGVTGDLGHGKIRPVPGIHIRVGEVWVALRAAGGSLFKASDFSGKTSSEFLRLKGGDNSVRVMSTEK